MRNVNGSCLQLLFVPVRHYSFLFHDLMIS